MRSQSAYCHNLHWSIYRQLFHQSSSRRTLQSGLDSLQVKGILNLTITQYRSSYWQGENWSLSILYRLFSLKHIYIIQKFFPLDLKGEIHLGKTHCTCQQSPDRRPICNFLDQRPCTSGPAIPRIPHLRPFFGWDCLSAVAKNEGI